MGEINQGGLLDLDPKSRSGFSNLPEALRLLGSGSLDLLDWSGLRSAFLRLIEMRQVGIN